jgi:hypothetical protein
MVINKEITETECNLWRKNKNINPLTNRQIKETSPIYKKFEKKCEKDDIYKIVNDFCLSIKKPSNINIKDIDIYDKIDNLCLKKKEIKLLKSSISPPIKHKKSSMYKSIIFNDIYKNNKKLLLYFNKFNNNSCLELTNKQNQYTLNKNILLYKQIGSKSVFGIVYKSKIINDNGNDNDNGNGNSNSNKNSNSMPKFVSKIQLITKEFKRELLIFDKLSKYAFKNNICHFPILYATSKCNNIIKNDKYPELLSKANNKYKNYSIILYELANGDLNSFINKYDSNLSAKIWKNIYEQIFMSIFLFHSLDLNHGDSHNGNFLYTKIKAGGCFHYRINNDDYYIENIGYKWMIWDYGNTYKLSELTKITFFDDYRYINLFLRKFDKIMNESKEFKNNTFYSDKKAGYINENANIPTEITKIQNEIWKHLGGLNDKYLIDFIFNKNKTEYDWFKYFIDNNILFSKIPIGTIISTYN